MLTALTTERRDLLPYQRDRHRPWPVLDTEGAQVRPWQSAALMAPSCVLRTPREWAKRFFDRAVALQGEVRDLRLGCAQ